MPNHVNLEQERKETDDGKKSSRFRVVGRHIRNAASRSWHSDKPRPKIEHPHLYGRTGGPEIIRAAEDARPPRPARPLNHQVPGLAPFRPLETAHGADKLVQSPYIVGQRQEDEKHTRAVSHEPHGVGIGVSSVSREELHSPDQHGVPSFPRHEQRRNFHLPQPNKSLPRQARKVERLPRSSSHKQDGTSALRHAPRRSGVNQDEDFEEDIAGDPTFLDMMNPHNRPISPVSATSTRRTSTHTRSPLSPSSSRPSELHRGDSPSPARPESFDFDSHLADSITSDGDLMRMVNHRHRSIMVDNSAGHDRSHGRQISTSSTHSSDSQSSGGTTSPFHFPSTSRAKSQHPRSAGRRV